MITPSRESEVQRSVCAWLQAFSPKEPLIAVPVYNAVDDALECVRSLLETTPAATPLLILDDASPDPRVTQAFEPLARHLNLYYARLPVNGGFSRTLNYAFEWGAPRDVVIVNSDVIVPEHWLERVQAAAYAQTNIATATPFTNHGTLLSVPYRNQPIPDLINDLTLAEADERIHRSSLQLRPIIPTAVGHLTYFRRAGLDTVGFFDEAAFSPGYGEEVDLSQRLVMAGLCHVVADDVFVLHKGSRSFGQESEARQKLQTAHDAIIHERYPWYVKWAEEAMLSPDSPLALTIERARGALLGYDIAIDATCLNGSTTGTQVGTLELVRALASAPNRFSRLTLIVGEGVPPAYLRGVEQFCDKIVTLKQLRFVDKPCFDLIHRPFQVVSANDLRMLYTLARRFIVSHLDSIAYTNPSYALTPEAWLDYRRQTEAVFATADGVAFISEHAAQDAADKGLRTPPERSHVVYFGVDHQLHRAPEAQPPLAAVKWDKAPFLLVIGTNFKHKNRAYAIQAFGALVNRYDWPGHLVLAGPHVASGGSESEELQAREQHPELNERIHDIGAVSEAEKSWLLGQATLVLYPSLYEGFGLIPFEAAAREAPVLTFRETALQEVLADRVMYLESHDPWQGAETIWRLINDHAEMLHQVACIQERAANFTWGAVADTTWNFYQQILRLPPRIDTTQKRLQTEGSAQGLVHSVTRRWRDWDRRLQLAVHVLQTRGWTGLRKEVRQYIRWRRAQF